MNILVADDEQLIHKSIEKLIKNHLPNAVIYHAYNGNQMLELLTEHPVALAYVDIKMPGLSGLDAIRQARETSSPFTRYYIMTGFDEFEYAKQAVKLKVDDYLMKPLDSKTIQETIQAAAAISRQQSEQKKNIFRNWLESATYHRAGSFYEYRDFYCCLVLFTIDAPDASADMLPNIWSDYEEQMVSILVPEGLLLLIFSQQPNEVQHIRKQLSQSTFPHNITCFAGSISNQPDELCTILDHLLSYSALRVLLGAGCFYHQTPLLNTTPQLLNDCRLWVKWQEAYFKKDYQAYTNCCEMLFYPHLHEDFSQKYTKSLHMFIAATLNRSQTGLPEYNHLKDFLTAAGKDLLTGPSQDSKAQTIIQFIKEHYREDISISELSKQFGLSANYISNLLKNALGIRYSEYITTLRLTHAKELLASTGLSVKEITGACGYYSQSHFTKLFLEHEGCTPLEFRKSVPSQ